MRIWEKSRTSLKPPPDLLPSEWADKYRYLPNNSARPGRWRTSNAEYQREILDCFVDPEVHTVVWMSGIQVGKTETLTTLIGYLMDCRPSGVLMCVPNENLARKINDQKINPMLRQTPRLRRLVFDRKREEGQTGVSITEKQFPRGFFALLAAESPSQLRSTSAPVGLADEIDAYPINVGKDGDPLELFDGRSSEFPNRKRYRSSTPTIVGKSKIHAEWLLSDQRHFYVPCHHCDEYQILDWKNVRPLEEGRPDTALYFCPHCGGGWTEVDRVANIRKGHWRAHAPFNGTAGFWVSRLYSPVMDTMREMYRKWVNANASKDEFQLQVFWNNQLGLPYEYKKGETIDAHALAKRAEAYGPKLPEKALVLTAGIDVQPNRLECQVVAWGEGYEAWPMDYRVFKGNPFQADVWNTLDEYLDSEWEHPLGHYLKIRRKGVDSGYATDQVYAFCLPRWEKGVLCLKGHNVLTAPLCNYKATARPGCPPLWLVGVNAAKHQLFGALRRETPGPGYVHFRDGLHNDEYFQSLTAEYLDTDGRWKKREAFGRNEALDTFVYAMWAAHIKPIDWAQERADLEALAQGHQKPSASTAAQRRSMRIVSQFKAN